MNKKFLLALAASACLALPAVPAAALEIIQPQQQLMPVLPPNASVAIHGRFVFVGSQGRTVAPLIRGVVFIYEKTSNQNCQIQSCWTFAGLLTRPDAFPGDRFGASVTFDGNTLLIGSPALSHGLEAVFVYARVGQQFVLRQTLTGDACDPPCAFSNFGISLALAGNRAAVTETSINTLGAAYVFKRSEGGIWQREAKLVPANAIVGDQYGISVDLTENTVVVGADEANYAAVFARHDRQWFEQQILIPWDTTFGNLGRSVALEGLLALIGAYVAPDGSNFGVGAAYLFERNHGTWTPVQKLLRSDDTSFQLFGVSVVLGNGRSAVLGRTGIYVFKRTGTVWENTAKLVNPSNFAAQSSLDAMDAHGSTLVAVTENGVWIYDLSGPD